MGLLGELEQLVWSLLFRRKQLLPELLLFASSSISLLLETSKGVENISVVIQKTWSWYWKVVFPVILNTPPKFTSGKLSGNTRVFCWLLAVCSAGFLQRSPCPFEFGPVQLQQNRRVLGLCDSRLLVRGGLKIVMCFSNHKTFGFLYYLFITSFRLLRNKDTVLVTLEFFTF